jgi:hypothetical protein
MIADLDSFTAVCSQIRSEFLPVLRLVRHVRVSPVAFTEYMHTFVPRIQEIVPFVHTPGIIELTAEYIHEDKLDIFSMAKIVEGSSNTKIVFSRKLGIAQRIMNVLTLTGED